MTINIYEPTANDELSRAEYELYTLINEYRVENGMSAIRLSADLTLTAGRHAEDVTQNIWGAGLELPAGASPLHSWSDVVYYSDGRDGTPMWEAPERLGTDYGNGYEISAGGFTSVQAAFEGFIASDPHRDTLLNDGIWNVLEWNAVGVGIVQGGPAGDVGLGGNIYHVWFGSTADTAPLRIHNDSDAGAFVGSEFSEYFVGDAGNDTISAADGADTIAGGAGDDSLSGGSTADDLRDLILGEDGDDRIDGGYGNDELYGNAGADTIEGGFGVDTVVGGDGDDVLTGSAWSDLIFGGDGDDFVNGGFGSDRVNGGAGADTFYHLGTADHGSDWIQDYDSAAQDVLSAGELGAAALFQVNYANTTGAGDADVDEAFIIYRPTGQILWALVDGADQDEILLEIGSNRFDLTA